MLCGRCCPGLLGERMHARIDTWMHERMDAFAQPPMLIALRIYYLPTYLPTYIPTYVPTYLPTYLPICLPTPTPLPTHYT